MGNILHYRPSKYDGSLNNFSDPYGPRYSLEELTPDLKMHQKRQKRLKYSSGQKQRRSVAEQHNEKQHPRLRVIKDRGLVVEEQEGVRISPQQGQP